jgi:hypothetical protein
MLKRMGRMRHVLGVGVVLLALAAAGCGGDDGGGPAAAGGGEPAEGAGLVPSDASGFVYLNTDSESGQWENLEALLDRFPDREQALGAIRSMLSAEGVTLDEIEAALGTETDVGILAFEGEEGTAVVLTQADDQARLDALIQRLDEASDGGGDTVKAEIDGWTVVSDSQAAIDAARRANEGESLADSEAFDEAMGDLSEDSLAQLYLNGADVTQALNEQTSGAAGSLTGGGTLQSLAGEVTAEEDGFGFHFVTRTEGGDALETYSPELLEQVPADALLYASFNGLGRTLEQASSNPQLQSQLGFVQGLLGVSVTELGDLLDGEGAVYVRPGSPFPEVTLAVTVENEQQAVGVVDRLAQRLGSFLGGGAAPAPQQIGDVSAKRLSLGQFAVYYAAFDGKLVISSATTGISGLGDGGDKLDDDETFQEATESAGMPDETIGFFYVNIEDALPLIENFSQTAGEPLPSEARSNLEPLRSLLVFGEAEEGKTSVSGFLRIE